MIGRSSALVTLLAGAVAACGPRSIQAPPPELRAAPERIAPTDAARAVRDARAWQQAFEHTRRLNFTLTNRGSPGRCDEIVGRFCFWHGERRTTPWEAPEDPDAVVRARERLLGELEAAVAWTPSDWWVVGQRVRYLVEAGRFDDALAGARDCRADPWWCDALEGYARHMMADIEAAEVAFDRALRRMPEDDHCTWNDITWLLDGSARRAYRRLSCVERSATESTFWWLAEPLYLLPGNDRRTEHFARRVMDRLQNRAQSGYGVSWGGDLTQLTIRYGWPQRWERRLPRIGSLETQGIIAHSPSQARTFEPAPAVLNSPFEADAAAFRLDPDEPRATHLPPYADWFDHLEHQLAKFYRGDSIVLVAAFDATGDHIPPGTVLDAGLFASWDVGRAVPLDRRPEGPVRGVLVGRALARPMLISVEALARVERRAARGRYGVSPAAPDPRQLGVSDLLVIDPRDPLPESLDEAIPRSRSALRLAAGERLGLFWEVYGVDTARVEVALHMRPEGRNWLRRTFEWVGLARERGAPVRLLWRDEPDLPAGTIARALAIDAPDLDPGVYRLTLEVTRSDGAQASAERVVVIEGR